MRALLIVALSVAALILFAEGEDAQFGAREFGDKLLANGEVKKINTVMGHISELVYYPGEDSYAQATITYINVVDHMPEGKGGSAYLLKGGVGMNHTTLKFVSQIIRALDFTYEIYGHEL